MLCTDENGKEVLLPLEHTNLGNARLCGEEQEGAICYAYSDLVELKKIVNSIINL